MKIEFNDVKIEVPGSWNDISLGEYEKWYMKNPETRLDMINYVSGICNIDADILLQSSPVVFNTITEAIQFVFNQDFKPENKCRIDGTDYFISLADKLTLGEYIDIDAVLNSDSNNKLSELLAIICRPAGEKYNPDLTEERITIFKNIKCDKALPLISFFLSRKKKSGEILNLYSKVTQEINQYQKGILISALNMDGIKRFRIWQGIKLYFLIRSQRKKLSKYSDSYFTKSTNIELRKNNINLKNR